MKAETGWWASPTSDGCIAFAVDMAVYPLDAIARASHEFTDRAYVFIESIRDATCRVVMRPKRDEHHTTLAGEFANALLDHKLRFDIAQQTKAIRDLIVAQAFVEADLLDRTESNSLLEDDPRGLRRAR